MGEYMQRTIIIQTLIVLTLLIITFLSLGYLEHRKNKIKKIKANNNLKEKTSKKKIVKINKSGDKIFNKDSKL